MPVFFAIVKYPWFWGRILLTFPYILYLEVKRIEPDRFLGFGLRGQNPNRKKPGWGLAYKVPCLFVRDHICL